MPAISFSLIRKRYPNINAENLDSITLLDLSKCSITEIDSMEIFEHLSELNLSTNMIERIENISFMSKLESLDLSFNKITAENLRCSLSEFPESLRTLNLSGNPCCDDESVLMELQDSMPNTGIIIGLECQEEQKIDEGFQEENNDQMHIEKADDNGEIDIISYQPLDSESILKSIVERKCHSQGPDRFDLSSCIEELNKECEVEVAKIKGKAHWTSLSDEALESRLSLARENYSKSRVDELVDLSRSNHSSMTSFMQRLKETSLRHRQELMQKEEVI